MEWARIVRVPISGWPLYDRALNDPAGVTHSFIQRAFLPTVVFHTATYGINTAGTVYRMDDVPIPLRPAFESQLSTDESVSRRIESHVRELVVISNPTN
jgi:hypothetical protein